MVLHQYSSKQTKKMRVSFKTQKILFKPFFFLKPKSSQLMTKFSFLNCPSESIHMQIKCAYNEAEVVSWSDSRNNTSVAMLFSIHRKHRNKPCVKKSRGAASESVDTQSFGQRHCFPRRSVSPL